MFLGGYMFYYNIAFDFENNNEFLCYYTIENRNNSIYSFTRATTKQKLGTFLILGKEKILTAL